MDKRFTQIGGRSTSMSRALKMHAIISGGKKVYIRLTDDVAEMLPSFVDVGYMVEGDTMTVCVGPGQSLSLNRNQGRQRAFIQADKLRRVVESNEQATMLFGDWVPVTVDGNCILFDIKLERHTAPAAVVEVAR